MNMKEIHKNVLIPLIALVLLLAPAATAVAQVSLSTEQLQNQVENVYEATNQSVANITTKALTMGMFNLPTTQKGAGSGFLYDDAGHVVTNYHVIQNAKTITVSLGEDQVYEAEIIGSDPLTDIAVLEIKGNRLPDPLPMGNSDRLNVGEFVVA